MSEEKPKRPNILLIVTDEERYPPIYENEEIKRFRREQLHGHRKIMENGIECVKHYSSSTACSPSRASLFTGQYPSLHRVNQTYGGAKEYNDGRLFWLEDDTVPTMGDYFSEAGYDCVYKGKWHISYEDIVDNHGEILQSAPLGGPISDYENEYLQKDALSKYGFKGWVGPEPHGTLQENSGMNRDPCYTKQVIDWLDERDKSGDENPFLLCCSFVNPHDIVFYPILWYWFRYPGSDSTVPDIPAPPTYWEWLKDKPTAQGSYIWQYRKMFQPVFFPHLYRKLYYYLHKVVDAEVLKIYEKLKQTRFFENTIVVFTSDHGDVLGAHGGMMQKWHNAYEEAIHIPLVFSHPTLFAGNQDKRVEFPTTHVDLIPTLLGLAGLDANEIMQRLRKTHSEAHPLVGKDFSRQLLGDVAPSPHYTIFFQTEDEITRGAEQNSTPSKLFPILKKLYHFEYDHVNGPTAIEGVITCLNGNPKHLWKLMRYWDNPENWSTPGVRDEYLQREFPGRGKKIMKTVPLPDEYEIYDLSTDPLEKNNLARSSDPTVLRIRKQLEQLLAEEKKKKRISRFKSPKPS
eukprot:TRINITY_DN2510_c0_g1_i5.p1 TRINITY_DN2510_c0_g1~~TRINITY_DN2510_c0_g1_i5.p1  ORF type:complete len:572 (+),score=114.16 TRINITY_DN2510_c0_g1_i5:50-1765(+)